MTLFYTSFVKSEGKPGKFFVKYTPWKRPPRGNPPHDPGRVPPAKKRRCHIFRRPTRALNNKKQAFPTPNHLRKRPFFKISYIADCPAIQEDAVADEAQFLHRP